MLLAHEHAEAAARREIVHESEQLQRMVEARAAAAGEVARRARRHLAAPAYVEPALVQHKPFLITAADEPAPVPRRPRRRWDGIRCSTRRSTRTRRRRRWPPAAAACGGRGGRRGGVAARAARRRRRRGTWQRRAEAFDGVEGLSEALDLREGGAAAAVENRREYRADPRTTST